ncbi:unnamed protein product [Sphenostylis stenocarpa]|uniref:Uncharacterized protein n=1 Tax=Sphenostylis stenocarpa TaxID=92480 RepID=A0AA86VS85_9FABA|nr:unnamed protein product [Sphenostylis stenocarpa]
MTKRVNPNPKARPFSAKRRGTTCSKYIVPGTLAKMRDSKITRNRRPTQVSSSLVSLTPSSTFQQDQPLNQDNGVPCFALPLYYTQPTCFNRKKLFAVTPTFTPIDTHQF